MNDTDRLIAAVFAATMTVRQNEPSLQGFFGFFDACLQATVDREIAEAAAKAERLLETHKKAWGQDPVLG